MSEQQYLRKRAADEIERASNAEDRRAAAAHAAMADEYLHRLAADHRPRGDTSAR